MVRMTWEAQNTKNPSVLIMLAEHGDADTQREVLARTDCPDEAVGIIAERAARDWDLQVAAMVLRRDKGCHRVRDAAILGSFGAGMAAKQTEHGACPPEDWKLLSSCRDLVKIAGVIINAQEPQSGNDVCGLCGLPPSP
jgi:hypothetical protein